MPDQEKEKAFDQVILQSKKENEQVEQKKRGRKKLPRDEFGNVIREAKPETVTPAQDMVQAVPPDHTVIKHTIEMPFSAIAMKTGCTAIALEPEISDSLAKQAAPVVAAWFPAMQSRETALVMFAVSLGAVAFGKYLVYSEWKKAQKAENEIPSQ